KENPPAPFISANLVNYRVNYKHKMEGKKKVQFICFIYSSNNFCGSIREEGMMNNCFPSENETIYTSYKQPSKSVPSNFIFLFKILTLIYTL
ncbi:hypothetical protein VIGAN_02124400, partial [Vigna angularis var. angularis]